MAGSLKLSDEGSRWLILGPAAVALHAAVFSFASWGSGSASDCAPAPSPLEFAIELPTETVEKNTIAIVAPESASVSHRNHSSDNSAELPASAPRATARPTSVSSRSPAKAVELPVQSLPAPQTPASAQLGPAEGLPDAELAGVGIGSQGPGLPGVGTFADGAGTSRSSKGATPTPVSGPRLLSAASACHGVLAHAAVETPAQVTIVLQVNKDGTASPKSVKTSALAALPGLKDAVRSCARRLRFAPAQTETGERIQAASTIRLTIGGHYSAHAPAWGRNRLNHI